MIGTISLLFSCVLRPEAHEKCNETAPILVLCYIKIANVPNLYVTQYNDWCNFVAYFVRFSAPEKHKKMQRNCTNHFTLLHKELELS